MHQSVAVINSIEFINLKPLDLNPLMSSCEIKVLYLGENRNHSYITKDVAAEMAKTLRGSPIVGYYKEDKGDFRDHGEQVILDDEGVKFKCLTKPYGFVAPDAKVWFQDFEDTDDFGNNTTRKYLMTTGYLWTGQYEEAKLAVDEGRPQSMELDEETLDGRWSTNSNTGMDFFIINDAIFSKLCILGNDVEPCFEGSRITAPEVSATFSKVDDNFKRTLFSMMEDLKSVLGGGNKMELEENKITEETPAVEVEETKAPEVIEENTITEEVTVEETPIVEENNSVEEVNNSTEEESITETTEVEVPEDYSLLKEELEELKTNYSKMEKEYNELVNFKQKIDNEKKDALIKSFYMLSDEDKKDVLENKAKYSLEEIEAKLSVICVRKKVNFDLDNTSKNENNLENAVVTYCVNNEENSTPTSDLYKALKAAKDDVENN